MLIIHYKFVKYLRAQSSRANLATKDSEKSRNPSSWICLAAEEAQRGKVEAECGDLI